MTLATADGSLVITLSALDVGALRKADTVSFLHHGGDVTFIDATKRAKQTESDPFARDMTHRVDVPSRFTDYEKAETAQWNRKYKCFAYISSAQYDPAWMTTASLLRAGDQLVLHWQRGGWTTQRMKECSPHFHADTLFLEVRRGDKMLTFHVDTSISEDNSARMIKLA